ncbi:protein AGENET DOMAIN (AGD)-CONTAINING P1-like isoform X1 [Typha angustifolia]|uniref:protein AGENET DOMAIN (AGD)-CONTAINING P1-like isoform X1 n=2 Tax=Typha angustifolia TaxID=59011 RepID=UPI003C2CA538
MPLLGFNTGDEVEVSSDEDGFRGAYFAARVVRSMPNQRRYTVDYDAFVDDSDPSRPLRETVDARHVRPHPPLRAAASGFTLYQVVDVSYNDAWWVGVVTSVAGVGRKRTYAVCFPASREEMDFGHENLRAHLEWVDGKWVLPESMESSNVMHEKGSQVEVARLRENFAVAWFPAVIAKVIWENSFLVEYMDLRNDVGTELLREIVDLQHIRPCPPREPGVSFCMLDEVEAFYGDGWWPGVITKIHDGSSYTVKSIHWDKEIEFNQTKLRLRYDWVCRQWIPASQKVLEIEFVKGRKVEVSSDDEGFRGAWYTATVVKSVGKKFLVEYQNLRTDDETKLLTETVWPRHIRPTPPNTPVVEFKLLEEVDVFYNDGWWVGIVSKVLRGPRYIVYFRTWNEEMEFGQEELRLHYDWICGRWIQASPGLQL